MEDEKYSVREFQRRFAAGEFDKKDFDTQVKAGWYDWFCSQKALANKTKRMGTIIKHIKEGGKVDLDKTYVFFNNNCPAVGNLYDVFKICDLESGEVVYVVECDCKRDGGRYVVFDMRVSYEKPVFTTESSRDLERWFNEPSI